MSSKIVPESTSALAVAAADGDGDAFRQLVRELYPQAFRTAVKVLGSRAEAEDAVQAAIIKLWCEFARYDPALGTIEGWFRRLLVNGCIDRRRSLRLVASIDAVSETPSDEPAPDEVAEASDRDSRVNKAVAGLNVRQRAAIVLFYGDGASMNEIADALETTPKAVEGLLARARADLAVRLEALRSS